ncbi:hypothetical protein DPMN_051994 [Dreissena polymorpha]|uniref:Uncharacterized protein n=1 Tax=Dreissena polymorpha TaxID=45954 RepID=A0A9D4CIV8_DREPO|nr:hypothetical protein DPMN_051994 [Dreissena polymorpha]
MAQSGVHVVLWEGDKDYRRVTVSPAIIGQPKKREALFRRMAVAQTLSDLPPCLDSWTSPLTSNPRSPTLCPISPLPESPKISLHSPQKSPPRKVQKRDPDISLSAVAAPSHSRKLTFEQLFNWKVQRSHQTHHHPHIIRSLLWKYPRVNRSLL